MKKQIIKHTCNNVAQGCLRSTMSTWKRREANRKNSEQRRGRRTTCRACAENNRKEMEQHAL